MSLTHCNTCGREINWNKAKRAELGVNGPRNQDLTVHKCYGAHKEETPKAVDLPTKDILALVKPETVDLTSDEIICLKQFVAMLKGMGK
ncbi:MAG: hypothetical protein DLM72_16665 [Candidatus Nitrosopolaris wilkensis]|nr:MAG: hypothetical protein DLM72_16665 [Candidatus Nitrosopolaris wilkensis]